MSQSRHTAAGLFIMKPDGPAPRGAYSATGVPLSLYPTLRPVIHMTAA